MGIKTQACMRVMHQVWMRHCEMSIKSNDSKLLGRMRKKVPTTALACTMSMPALVSRNACALAGNPTDRITLGYSVTGLSHALLHQDV